MLPKSFSTFESLVKDLAEPGIALSKSLEHLSETATEAVNANLAAWEKSVRESLAQVAEAIRKVPIQQRDTWIEAAEHGWFINWHTPIPIDWQTAHGYAALDSYMITHLEQDWDAIISSIQSAFPERNEIITCALDLHKEKRYIASIPLFLAQADGIYAQCLGVNLFADPEEREHRLVERQADGNDFTVVLLELLGLKTQFGAGISKSSAKRKQLAPNRSGILHGARKHLDYGTAVNSFKSLSLLAFVAFVLSTSKSDDSA